MENNKTTILRSFTIVALYTGRGSQGGHAECAQRADGTWFARHSARGRFGAWAPCATPEYVTERANAYSGETTAMTDPTLLIHWGFGTLVRCDGPLGRLRLPS